MRGRTVTHEAGERTMRFTMTTTMVLLFALNLAVAQAQKIGGQQQTRVGQALTPQAIRAKTRSTMKSVPGKRVANAHASEQLANNPMVVSLKTQAEAAKSERAELVARPPSSKSRIAGSMEARATEDPCMVGKPAIASISGQRRAVFSPDPQYNPYTIRGCNLGTGGQLHLAGPFHASQINMNVIYWGNDAIVASVDPNVSGELDENGVHLVVSPAGEPTVDVPGNSFYAVRATTTLASIPQDWVQLAQVKDATGAAVGLQYSTNPGGGAMVSRASGNRFSGGQDYYDFSHLKPGFVAANYGYSYLLQDCSSDIWGQSVTLYNDGSFNFSWDGTNIQVVLGAQTCHIGGVDSATSFYTLTVDVSGPRGVDPLN